MEGMEIANHRSLLQKSPIKKSPTKSIKEENPTKYLSE